MTMPIEYRLSSEVVKDRSRIVALQTGIGEVFRNRTACIRLSTASAATIIEVELDGVEG